MSENKDPTSTSSAEEEVWIAISAFEQILEAMPHDRASLEALSHAYEQIGDHTRAKDYLARLAEVLLAERDADGAAPLVRQLAPYVEDDPELREIYGRLQALARGARTDGLDVPDAGIEAAPAAVAARFEAFSLADELSFAWALLETHHLTQEEYASVVQDLTEMSSAESDATVSVLHALEFRAFKGLERLMSAVSKECAAPIVTLSLFDLSKRASGALPLDFMAKRGTLVFDFVGDEALVVVMNPYDEGLRQSVAKMTGCKCHFFITLPSEFDKAITKIRDGQKLPMEESG